MMMASAFGQRVALEQTGRNVVAELPRPEWRQERNQQVAELRIDSADAAALRVNFASLGLPEGAEMYLVSQDAAGNTLALHGPYTGRGPLNVPEFDSQLLRGTTLKIIVRGASTAEWPFEIHGVEALTAEDLGAQETPERYQPREHQQATEVRNGYYKGVLMNYVVENGLAVTESDIVLGTAEQMAYGVPAEEVEIDANGVAKKDSAKASFALTNDIANRWNGGYMYFTINNGTNIPLGGSLDTKIRAAIAYWNSRFPNILVPRTNQSSFVTFTFTSGVCRSPVGRIGGQQFIELDDVCSQGNITHEIAHALGFPHEHTRNDRNSFVSINWSNIPAANQLNFQQYPAGTTVDYGNYDFGSIMHYGLRAFASNTSVNTINPLVPIPAGVTVGQRNGLSTGDEAGVRARYCAGMYYLMPSVIEVDNFGDSGGFTATIPSYCAWTITDNATWLTVTSALSGTGSTTVSFTATRNSTGKPRNGAIRINGRSVTIRQIPPSWE